MTAKPSLFDHPADALRDWMIAQGYPPYRAKQVMDWAVNHRAQSFEAMTNLPKTLRERLAQEWQVFGTSVAHHDISPDGTEKLLLSCSDQSRIECVLMYEDDRRTVCISSQVGCGMGCVFCASGLKGVVRNLTRGELLEQVLHVRNQLPAGERLTNLVVMGMGESLANLDNLVSALDWLCSPEGFGMSQRRITISTVGLPDKMRKLAEMDRQYHLAVSLHAPTAALRNELVPINEKVGLDDVMNAADAYFQRSGRQVTFEYVMLSGVNDRREEALALAELLHARKAHVNLIPYNPVAGLRFERPSDAVIHHFVNTLRSRGLSVSVRKTKGRLIDAACGQLRRRVAGSDTSNELGWKSKVSS